MKRIGNLPVPAAVASFALVLLVACGNVDVEVEWDAAAPSADARTDSGVSSVDASSDAMCVEATGETCGSCGGIVSCEGDCVPGDPADLGESCGSCGGVVLCDTSCSVATPAAHGQSCGQCGGTVNCANECSIATPPTFGNSCDSCGGTIRCDGTCSIPNPPGYGGPCGSCGGVVQCGGSCSIATPSNFGDVCQNEDCQQWGCRGYFVAVFGCSGTCDTVVQDCDCT